ncbi:MAG TPA: cytochrome P450 [Longimicrobium sp.]|nr:cytochrome P450 [Longimicrobium sp.]
MPRTAVSLPPGPRGRPLIGNLAEFSEDALGFLTRCAREHGDVVRLGKSNYLVCHPRDIEQVLVGTNRLFVKRRNVVRLEKPVPGLFSEAMMNSEGAEWLHRRRTSQPAFHRERVAACAELIVRLTEDAIAEWRPGETRDPYRDMRRLSLDVVSRFLFGETVAGEARRIAIAVNELMRAASSPVRVPRWMPTPGNRRFQRAMRDLDDLLYALVARQRARPSGGSDLMALLLAGSNPDGSPLTDVQLRDELATMIMSGHETTTDALVWTWWLLARHPEAEERLLAEVEQVLADAPAGAAELPRLRYVEAVVKESMRLYPPGWMTSREAVADCELGGYPVPAGTTVAVSQWVTHRDPRFFADAEAFRPERWLDGSLDGLPKYAYFPFGGGPRFCIGASLAMIEAVLILATVARRFRLEAAPGIEVVAQPAIALRPLGVRVVVRGR